MSVSCEHAFQICSSCIVLSSSVQRFPFVCIVPHTLCTQKCGICCKICVQQLLLSAMRSCPLFFLQDEAQAYTSSKRSRHAGRPFLLARGMSNSSGTGSGIPGGYTVVLTLALYRIYRLQAFVTYQRQCCNAQKGLNASTLSSGRSEIPPLCSGDHNFLTQRMQTDS